MVATEEERGLLTPDQEADFGEAVAGPTATHVIACGALAREIVDLIAVNGLENLSVSCLPAKLHNYPAEIPERMRAKIREKRGEAGRILVAYADCGTGGLLDKVIAEESRPDCPVERIGGPHCYAFFAGQNDFEALAEEELGTFYLTDYLARHFDTLIVKGLGLDKYPGMVEMMFGNYKRLVYLAQTDDPALDEKAAKAAERLGLAYCKVKTGYGELADFLSH